MSWNSSTESAEKVYRALTLTDQTTAQPVLFVISGLPGTGKSYLARQLAQRLPCVIIESDFVRKALAGAAPPTYTGRESALVHRVAHMIIKRLLESGRRVIFDATTIAEWQREKLYHLADETHSKIVIIRTIAPEEVVHKRLTQRFDRRAPYDISDADWNVHQRMKSRQETVRHPHLVVDTSADLESALIKILRAAR